MWLADVLNVPEWFFFAVGGALFLIVLVFPLVALPKRRHAKGKGPAQPIGFGTSNPDRNPALENLRRYQDGLAGRLQELETERRQVLRAVTTAHRSNDTEAEAAHRKEHLHLMRLKRQTQAQLTQCKERYNRLRAALYAARDQEVTSEFVAAQRRANVTDRLNPKVAAAHKAAVKHADRSLERALDVAGHDPYEVPVPKDEERENDRLIDRALANQGAAAEPDPAAAPAKREVPA